MTHARQLFLACSIALAVACGDDEAATPNDGSAPMLDGSMMQDAEAGSPDDAALPDGGTPPDDAAMDASADSGADGGEPDGGQDSGADASDPVVVHAVIGERCALTERIGLIELKWGSVFGSIYDRPNAVYGEPELHDDACDFHRAPAGGGACDHCDYAVETCGAGNVCAPLQVQDESATVTLVKGGDSQVMAFDVNNNAIYGEVTLALPFGMEVAFGERTVVLAESDMPAGLTNPQGMLMGDSSAPGDFDITWSGAADGTVFTHVPMNHHVGGPTFTECAVPASANELHIDGEMLAPLALETGLEFQGIEHMLVAAAETPEGCVEIRYSTQHSVAY